MPAGVQNGTVAQAMDWVETEASSKTVDEAEDRETADSSTDYAEKNKIGFIGCTSYVLGNVIGAGIFIVPSVITANVGSVGMTLIVWLICGLLSLLGLFHC